MNQKDAETLLDHEERTKPLTDACIHCGASRFSSRHSNYLGCSFCRQMNPKHQGAESIGMGALSDKYCAPFIEAYLGGDIWVDLKTGIKRNGENPFK